MASSYQNVNPMTEDFMKGWGSKGDLNFFDYTRQSLASSGVMDPNSIISNFESAAPGLMSMAMGATNPYTSAIDAYTNAITPRVLNTALAPYSSENAFYSSGAVQAGTQAVGEINLQAQAQKLQAQTGLLSTLLSGGMSALTSGQNTSAGLFSSMLGIGGDFATPIMQEQQNPFMQILGLGVDLLGAGAPLLGSLLGGGSGSKKIGASAGGK